MTLSSGPSGELSGVEMAMFRFVDAYERAYEAAAAQHGLSIAQACVLGRIGRPYGMRELALELGCDASNVTQIVKRLEARGLIERRPNPRDSRFRVLSRTAAGDALCGAFEQTFEFARTAASRLTAEEGGQLAALLSKSLGIRDGARPSGDEAGP